MCCYMFCICCYMFYIGADMSCMWCDVFFACYMCVYMLYIYLYIYIYIYMYTHTYIYIWATEKIGMKEFIQKRKNSRFGRKPLFRQAPENRQRSHAAWRSFLFLRNRVPMLGCTHACRGTGESAAFPCSVALIFLKKSRSHAARGGAASWCRPLVPGRLDIQKASKTNNK